jgi:hypothetical protein
MNMKSIFRVFGLAVATLIFSQCGDDDVPALEYQQQGVIKGTITGTTSEGSVAINESFSYTQYQPGLYGIQSISYYETDDDGSIDIYIIRFDVETGGYFNFRFSLDDAADTQPNSYMNMQYRDNDFNDKVLDFYMSSSGNDLTISDFSFESASGRTKGKYVVEGTENSTGKNATISGEFDVVVKQVVH